MASGTDADVTLTLSRRQERYRLVGPRERRQSLPLHCLQDPKILVQFRHKINDTALPGLEFGFDKVELSVKQKGATTDPRRSS